MNAAEWFDCLLRRPDFEKKALSLRNDVALLEAFLTEFFHASALPEPLRSHVVAGLRDRVLTHDGAEHGTLYQECVWVIQVRFRDGMARGEAPEEWSTFPRVPHDFESRALSVRLTKAELRAYLAEAFRDILTALPAPIAERTLDGLEAAVVGYSRSRPEGLLAQCISAIAEQLPPEVSAAEVPRHQVVARETKLMTKAGE